MKESPSTHSAHESPEDCAEELTVHFTDEYVMCGERIMRLAECVECGRKFERVWQLSHDQCYDPELERVTIEND